MIEDAFTLNRDVREIVLALITPSVPSLVAPDTVALAPRKLPGNLCSAAGCVRLGGVPLALSCETVSLTDQRLTTAWGDCIHRVLVRLDNPARAGRLVTEVLAPCSAVRTACRLS